MQWECIPCRGGEVGRLRRWELLCVIWMMVTLLFRVLIGQCSPSVLEEMHVELTLGFHRHSAPALATKILVIYR